MNKRGRPTKSTSEIKKLKQDLAIAKARVNHLENLILNTWWVLTDITAHGLRADRYLDILSENLSYVAIKKISDDEISSAKGENDV